MKDSDPAAFEQKLKAALDEMGIDPSMLSPDQLQELLQSQTDQMMQVAEEEDFLAMDERIQEEQKSKEQKEIEEFEREALAAQKEMDAMLGGNMEGGQEKMAKKMASLGKLQAMMEGMNDMDLDSLPPEEMEKKLREQFSEVIGDLDGEDLGFLDGILEKEEGNIKKKKAEEKRRKQEEADIMDRKRNFVDPFSKLVTEARTDQQAVDLEKAKAKELRIKQQREELRISSGEETGPPKELVFKEPQLLKGSLNSGPTGDEYSPLLGDLKKKKEGTMFVGRGTQWKAEDPIPESVIPSGSNIVVAGGTTALGTQILRDLAATSNNYKLKALVWDDQSLDESLGTKYSGKSFEERREVLSDASALIIVSEFAGGNGGVNPDDVKQLIVEMPIGLRRLVYVSVHGSMNKRIRKTSFFGGPNYGKLQFAESIVLTESLRKVASHSILRVGQLTDGGSPGSRCRMAPGDGLEGEIPITSAATVVMESLVRAEPANKSFTLAPLSPTLPQKLVESSENVYWNSEFLKLVGPEIFRYDFKNRDTEPGLEVLRKWAIDKAYKQTFPGSWATLDDLVDKDGNEIGIVVRWVTKPPEYPKIKDWGVGSVDRWPEVVMAKYVGGPPDGALYFFSESAPNARIRICRAEMEGVISSRKKFEAVFITSLSERILNVEEKAKRR